MSFRVLYTKLIICFLCVNVNIIVAQNNSTLLPNSIDSYSVDSIVDLVSFYAPYYERIVKEYEAKEYMKVNVDIVRRNLFMRYLPTLFTPIKGVRDYIVETYTEKKYSYPSLYDQRIIAITGTTPKLRGPSATIYHYFNINIYAQSFFNNKLLSPFAQNSRKHYRYKIEKIENTPDGNLNFTIKYWPKTKSFQTVSGYFVVTSTVWSVRELKFVGESEYFIFSDVIKMGEVGADNEFLPLLLDVNSVFRFLGNKIRSSFNLKVEYDSIKFDALSKKNIRSNRLDLTDAYLLQINDTIRKADKNFDSYRKMPLSLKEMGLYQDFYIKQKNDSIKLLTSPSKKKSTVFWGAVGDVLVSNHTINLVDMGSVKFSPLLNPFLLTYNGSDGFSYKYKIKYNQLFKNNRLLSIAPMFGYRLKKKEFYWNVDLNFLYLPKHIGKIKLDVGNGNRIYSSEVLNDLKNQTDTIDFNKLNLTYFKSLHFNLMHSIELTNGLELAIGLASNKREAIKTAYQDSLHLGGDFSGRYVSVAPRVRLSWTPQMYYYMNGKRKINLKSKYPTFSIDWERGMKGLFGSTGSHERVEFDIQHKVPLGLMRSFFYRIGGGLFTNQDQVYFVDFVYFAKRNLPTGWNDDIGGIFQLLDERWYNASQYYGRLNMVYDSPFLLLPHVRGLTKWVLRERVYANALIMNQLKPYFEVGYGVGTHIFDLGVFWGLSNWHSSKIGFKITFELFNR